MITLDRKDAQDKLWDVEAVIHELKRWKKNRDEANIRRSRYDKNIRNPMTSEPLSRAIEQLNEYKQFLKTFV